MAASFFFEFPFILNDEFAIFLEAVLINFLKKFNKSLLNVCKPVLKYAITSEDIDILETYLFKHLVTSHNTTGLVLSKMNKNVLQMHPKAHEL